MIPPGSFLLSSDVELIAAGDVDNNGNDDLVVAGGNKLITWQYVGSTWEKLSMHLARDYYFAHQSLAITDFDGNGVADLLVAYPDTVSVWRLSEHVPKSAVRARGLDFVIPFSFAQARG